MPEKANKTSKQTRVSSFAPIIERFNKLAGMLPEGDALTAFARAGFGMANMPTVQNMRVKAISSLPCDYTKDEIGGFLRNPYDSEKPLRQTSEILRFTAYPYFKITKTYADIPTYRYYSQPRFVDETEAKKDEFKREAKLIDKIEKTLRPDIHAHKITGQAATQGKVFYTLRTSIDKAHNTVNHAFMQQLPSDWCTIIGYNNVSGYTISFNLMYFLQPGTDYRQYGDLFLPYLDDFSRLFEEERDKVARGKHVYNGLQIDVKGVKRNFYPENFNGDFYGDPRFFEQNGRWMYWVSLPIDKVWAFEIDDTTAAVVSPLAGLMLTYAQQSDYEAAQLSLLLNPLIKIFTGEIPYFNDKGTEDEDSYKLSPGGRQLFEAYFDALMSRNNTSGTALFSAPLENIKSHDFAESANANEISKTFNEYAGSKAGLNALIPTEKDIKAAQVESARLIESRYAVCIYRQFERMMNALYGSLNLRYEWQFVMFGSIFTDETIRENAKSMLDMGDTSALFVLAALDGQSWLDKLSMVETINASGIMDKFRVPQTAYTQSGKTGEVGRPSKTIEDLTSGNAGESTEDAIDSYGEA